MRFPSLQSLAVGAWQTFRRFPIAILLALKATVLGIWWTHLSENYARRYVDLGVETRAWPLQWYWNAIVSCYLGMLLSVALTKWAEKRQQRQGEQGVRGERFLRIGLQAGVLALTALYYWSLPAEYSAQMVTRTVVLALGLHWLIAVIGFGRGEVNGFWVFNKRLFLRVLTTYLYSIVLYIGVSLALLAVDKLFNVDVRSEVYEECWWVLGGLFSVWFFLAGFPKTYENPGEISDYPRGLKIFTQYVLLSLVTVYLLILYAYMIKIILTRHWPAGWVAWMVMVFSVAGILSLLLIYPLRNLENNTWIRGYTRFFYQALLPLIILLFTAIYKRIGPYGITEQRYFLQALAWWLLFITVYFLVSRKKDIRLVPLSLSIFSFLSCWGPWGAFAVSLHSQRHRLEELLGKNRLLASGKVVAAENPTKISLPDRVAITSVTEYLVDKHGYHSLQPMFSRNLDSLMRTKNASGILRQTEKEFAILELINIPYTSRWETYSDTSAVSTVREFVCTRGDDDSATITGGAMYLGKFAVGPGDSDWDFVGVGHDKLRITVDTARSQLKLAWVSGGKDFDVDLGPLAERILRVQAQYSVSLTGSELELPFSNASVAGKVVLNQVEGERREGKIAFRRIRGLILFSKR